jgi:hypothetical protein
MAALKLVDKSLDPYETDCDGRAGLHVSNALLVVTIAFNVSLPPVARSCRLSGHADVLHHPAKAANLGAR